MNIAAYIDHTILKPDTTSGDVKRICDEAIKYSFAAVCVPPYYCNLAKQYLTGSKVKLATVIGFPFGYSSLEAKLHEIEDAITDGVDELDMVHNMAALKNSDWAYLQNEVRICTEAIHHKGKQIKIIVESGILTDKELVDVCKLYAPLGIDFMKTSTGYASVGATTHAVQLMRQHLPEEISIKASGGIRTFTFAKELIAAGATRLGCSASVDIVNTTN